MRAYRGGCNFSFLVRHNDHNIQIHPSANFLSGMFKNERVDIVFLGVGTLGRQSKQFAASHWREVVQATKARFVIPIHSDDFTITLIVPQGRCHDLLDNFG